MKNIKLLRIFVFFVSVVALSRFFEAGRLISSELSVSHIGVSILPLLVFVSTLFFMGYWVYVEEKEKNNLRIKFGLYEWFYEKLSAWRSGK